LGVEGGFTLESMKTNTPSNSTPMLFAGIDYHKRYSVVHVLDVAGVKVKTGRIEPNSLPGFAAFFASFAPGRKPWSGNIS